MSLDRLRREFDAKVAEFERAPSDSDQANPHRAWLGESGTEHDVRLLSWLNGLRAVPLESREPNDDGSPAIVPRGGRVRPFGFRIEARHKQRVLEQRDLTKLTAGAGGASVGVGFQERLYEHLVEVSGIRRTGVQVFTTDTGEDFLVPKSTGGSTATLVAEAAAFAESDPAFGQATLKAFKYGLLIQVSNELVADTGVDLLDFVARQAGRAVGLASGAHFITGTGTGQPEGVQTNVTVGKTAPVGNTTAVHADSLFDVYHSVPTGYREVGSWLMLDATLNKCRQLRDGAAGQYIFPSLWAEPPILLGRPVITDPGMPALAANVKGIIFGDFSSGYAIRDVVGLRFDQAPGTAFGNDLLTLRISLRTDGRPVDAAALRALQQSAT